MKFMLLIQDDETARADLSEAEIAPIVQGHRRLREELASAGKLVSGHRLRPPNETKRIELKNNRRLVMDGPFTETKEVLGGFYLVECENMDEAIEYGKRIPMFGDGKDAVEVRAIWEMS